MWKKIIKKILSAFSDQTKNKIIQKYLSLHSYFRDVPHWYLLEKWAKGEWPEYQSWLDSHSLDSVTHWKYMRNQSNLINNPPKISILVPTYNTNPEFFEDLIRSVFFQTLNLEDPGPGLFRQHFLYFLPLPQGQGSLRPIFLTSIGEATLKCFSLHAEYIFLSFVCRLGNIL